MSQKLILSLTTEELHFLHLFCVIYMNIKTFSMTYTTKPDTVILFKKRRKVQSFLQRLKLRRQLLLVLDDWYFTIYSSTSSCTFMKDIQATLYDSFVLKNLLGEIFLWFSFRRNSPVCWGFPGWLLSTGNIILSTDYSKCWPGVVNVPYGTPHGVSCPKGSDRVEKLLFKHCQRTFAQISSIFMLL